MNYLLTKFIRSSECICFCQEFDELIAPNPNTIELTAPPAKPGEAGLLKFLTQSANLMRLDALYVGEVKGEEAWPLIIQLASGTRGGCTTHGEDPQKALNRLCALCMQGGAEPTVVTNFVRSSVKYVVQMSHHEVNKIVKLTGTSHNGVFGLEEIAS
jgi:Flp pilus assembly CpaF family ATPase